LKSKITGNVKCNNETEIKNCETILKRFNINYECNHNNININGFVKTTPLFNRDGFQKMLYTKLGCNGKVKLNVGI